MKPDNVMIDCYEDDKGGYEIKRVVLSDLDCALKLEGEKLLNARMGNVMWRNPEAQIGKGIGKLSDVFSYGLLVSRIIYPLNIACCSKGAAVSLCDNGYRNTTPGFRRAQGSRNRA